MSLMLMRLMKPLIVRRALAFLHEKDLNNSMNNLLREKITKIAGCEVGKKLDITPSTSLDKIPITGYDYYLPFFENPQEGYFMYPLEDYVKTYTSGTMSKPKVYLQPQTGIQQNLKSTVISSVFLSTYNDGACRFNFGDILYANLPGGSFLAAFVQDGLSRSKTSLINFVPENANQLSFEKKVEYFVNHSKEINMAYMTVTTLLDEIKHRVPGPLSLKSFITTDISAAPLKERIKQYCGTYPSTIYGSTETMLIAPPSRAYPGGFIFDWRVVYPEFLPEDKAVDTNEATIDEPPETIPLTEVEAGKRYQLIATPYTNDMTRFAMPDIFECVGVGDDELNTDLPVFRYYSRSDKLLVLHNFTRINEAELVSVLENAKIPYVDFTARRELEETHERLALYIELSEEISQEDVFKRVSEELIDFDKDYRDLVNFLKYDPLKVNVLPKGTFKRYLQSKTGMPRIARVGMRDEQLDQLRE